MADLKLQPECARCVELEARIAVLEGQLAKLQKHSGNSSKPPSSDIVKPPKKQTKPGRRRKRRIGGQPGHPRHERRPFTEEELDRQWVWWYDACPCCSGPLVDDPRRPSGVLSQSVA